MIREVNHGSGAAQPDRPRPDRKALKQKAALLRGRVEKTCAMKNKVESRLLRAASRFRDLRRLYSRQVKELHQVEEALRFHARGGR